jgi:hypothetical protein
MMTGTQVAREHARYPELDSLDTKEAVDQLIDAPQWLSGN